MYYIARVWCVRCYAGPKNIARIPILLVYEVCIRSCGISTVNSEAQQPLIVLGSLRLT